jgi:hypothetical protein
MHSLPGDAEAAATRTLYNQDEGLDLAISPGFVLFVLFCSLSGVFQVNFSNQYFTSFI